MGFDVSILSELFAIWLLLLKFTCSEDLQFNRHVQFYDNWFFQLHQPDEIGYTYKIRPAKDFGGVLNQSHVNIELVPTEPLMACSPVQNGILIKNNIAFAQRGDCSFLEKAVNAQAVGALAVIIMDHDIDNDSRFVDMISDGTDREVKIPAFYLLGKDGYMILKLLEERRMRSASITIPINATGIPPHLLNQPPWTLW